MHTRARHSHYLRELATDGISAIAKFRPGILWLLVLGRVHHTQLQAEEGAVVELLPRVSVTQRREWCD